MIELDPHVAAVWRTVLNGQADWLSSQIRSFKFTRETVVAELNKPLMTLRHKAWLTLLRNRVSHGGILAPGSGLLNRGENDKGLKSRWYPRTLSNRIAEIYGLKERISFIEGDGLIWLKKHEGVAADRLAFFIDPPYVTAGQRLYAFCELDHRGLFEVASRLPGKVLMTYEDSPQIRRLAADFGFALKPINMVGRQQIKKTELLIGKSFEWLKL